MHLHLNGAAPLISLPKLAATLEEVRLGAEVRIHFEHLDYIDHICLDLQSNRKQQCEITGATQGIEWEASLKRNYQRLPGILKNVVRLVT